MDSNKLPFSLFDFFALIFPGAFGLLGLLLNFAPNLAVTQPAEINLTITFIFILASYIFGHALHAASEIIIDRGANLMFGSLVGQYLHRVGLAAPVGRRSARKLLGDVRNLIRIDWNPDVLFDWNDKVNDSGKDEMGMGRLILLCLKQEFRIVPEKINHIFQLVLAFSQKNTKGETNEVPVFAAIETMFRSLALAALLLFVGLARVVQSSDDPAKLVLIGFILFLLIALFLYSYRRYKRMWVETIFAQFVVASSERHPPAKKTRK